MSSKLQPAAPEPSPQILSERCPSFSRADANKASRPRPTTTDNSGEFEAFENLSGGENSCEKTAVTTQHRHSASSFIDLHPLALHPINLNSKFDHLCLPASPVKVSVKVSVILDQVADKESSFVSIPVIQNEEEGETPEELSLEPHESLLQEESFSASFSAGSKSPREDEDFILWGNAAFCLSDARNLISSSSIHRQRERFSEESIQNHSQTCSGEQNKHLLLLPKDGFLLPVNYSIKRDDQHHGVASAAVSTACEISMGETEESVRRQSSIGSTLSVHDPSATRQVEFRIQEIMDASPASDCDVPTNTELKGVETSSKSIKEEGLVLRTQGGQVSSSNFDVELCKEGVLMAAEEVKIRAELELEVERDLEQEIRTKIFLLNRRLEELHHLQANRHPKQEKCGSEKAATTEEEKNGSSLEKDESNTTKKDTSLPRLPVTKRKLTVEQGKGLNQVEKMISRPMVTKKQPPAIDNKDVHFSYANTPVTSWRKFATDSGWVSTQDDNSCLPSSNGGFKGTKVPKHSVKGATVTMKPKVQVGSTSSFKQDYQTCTAMTNSKKFDWIRTLRSDVPSTPRMAVTRFEGSSSEEVKDTVCGNVVRTLFPQDGTSTPEKPVSIVHRRDSDTISTAECIKKTVIRHGTPADAVPPTPRIRSTPSVLLKHDNVSGLVSAKQVNQRQIFCDPGILAKTPDLWQGKTATLAGKTSHASRVSPQQASGKIDRKSNVEVLALTKQASMTSKSSSPLQVEKLKRSESSVPSTARSSIRSKETKVVALKTSSSCSPQTSKSRLTPSPRPASSSQASKGRIVPSDILGRRQSSTVPKA